MLAGRTSSVWNNNNRDILRMCLGSEVTLKSLKWHEFHIVSRNKKVSKAAGPPPWSRDLGQHPRPPSVTPWLFPESTQAVLVERARLNPGQFSHSQLYFFLDSASPLHNPSGKIKVKGQLYIWQKQAALLEVVRIGPYSLLARAAHLLLHVCWPFWPHT